MEQPITTTLSNEELKSLLFKFIGGAIGIKDFYIADEKDGEQIYLLDPAEEHFHVEFIKAATDKVLAYVYTRSSWKISYERTLRIKAQAEKERQAKFDRDEAIVKLMTHLEAQGKHTKDEMEHIRTRIDMLDPMYIELGKKFGLIPADFKHTVVKKSLMDEIDSL